MRKSDSGVVMRMSGRSLEHRRPLLRRRVAGANRDRELGADAGERPAQVAFDVVVQRLQRADVEHLSALAGLARGRAPRGTPPASFPEPVGAWMSTWRPVAMAGQPRSCAGVGPSNVRSNQPRTPGLKGASALMRPAYPSEVELRLRPRDLPSLLRGTPSHHPLPSLQRKSAPVARARCRDRRETCRDCGRRPGQRGRN